ncbi:UDP-N-acetylmuramoyl-L-alanine--D-glutamate ligase [Allobaculum stercoricanis]|uniref:UDP-N-acetylmuramoyl-L-alanine--D-glutamate ligase n=1 Tax=Allobaculum stercoricanis TaxID=174709 RepID=UPI00035F30BD|nr:UDP-N-acetylmuramoyl-L-alanine--D-glutamate ligase [Allobaculum stercoricanis]
MKQVLLIGAARSGINAAKLLNNHGYHVVLTDQNKIENKEELETLGIEVFDQGHPDCLKEKEYDFVVKNPGIPYRVPFIAYFLEKKVPIYTEIETAFWFAPKFSYGAITGTDGKTTVTTLLYEMLKAQFSDAKVAGNIGVPLSEIVLGNEEQTAHVALELSNFQLLGIEKFRPHVSVVTNLAPDHLDYMNSLEDYYASKFKIYENCDENDFFIRNVDDPTIIEYAQNIPCQVIDCSLNRQDVALHIQDGFVCLHDIQLFCISDLKLVGQFNLMNAMQAACIAYLLGVNPETIQHVIEDFKGVEHRIEYVDTIRGVRIYNDSKATNTHSAMAALSSFESGVHLLAGGKDKGIDYSELKQYDDRVKTCYAFGQIEHVFEDIFSRTEICHTMECALNRALEQAKEGEVILLCPATSSFDQFKNYEVRGQIFKELVKKQAEKIES